MECTFFSQTQFINHINDKKFMVESYSSNSNCCSVLNSFIDALSWHTGRNHYCYAVAFPIAVDFAEVDKTDSWVLTKAKNIKCDEVQTSECQVNKNIWLHSYSYGCNESESFTSVNSFTNPYALYSPEYVLSLCQVSAGTIDTNLVDLASNLGRTNIGQEVGTCKRQSDLSLLLEAYSLYCSGPGIGSHNSVSQVLNTLSHGSGLEYMYYSALSFSYFSSNNSFPLYDTNYDIIYDNLSALDASPHCILETDALLEGGTWPWCGLLAVNLVLYQIIYQKLFLLPNLMSYLFQIVLLG